MKKLKIFETNELDDLTPLLSATGHYINDMFDLHASGGTNILGYGHPKINSAIEKCLKSYNTSFWRLKHQVWDEFTDKLDSITNNKYHSYIPSLTGSDAIDNALKLIWYYWHNKNECKTTILVGKNSYHSGSITGWQMVNVTGLNNGWPKIEFVEFFDNLEETVLQIGPEKIAAVLIDTVPWNDGLHEKSLDYWKTFQNTIDRYNLLLCVDEVITGIGRMGVWIHSHELGLKPNIIILGKALGGGHADINLTIIDKKISEEITDVWLAIGNTRSVNTLGAAVSLNVINIIEEENILDHVSKKVIPYCNTLKELLIEKGMRSYSAGAMVQAYGDIKNIERHLKNKKIFHNWNYFKHLPFYNINIEDMDNILNIIQEYKHELD